MAAVSRLEAATSIRMTPAIRTIQEEMGVGDEEGDHRVDPEGDQVEMGHGVMAGMAAQDD